MPARRWTARRLVSPRSRLNSYPSSFVTVAGLRAVFGEYGMPLAIDVWASVIGGTGHRDMLFDYLEGELGRQGGRARADAGLQHDVVDTLPAREGAAEFIAQAKEAGLALGVAHPQTRAEAVGETNAPLCSPLDGGAQQHFG